MILESVALVGGFLVTAIVGTPLAVLLARGRGWKDEREVRPHTHESSSGYHRPGFTPLDLGPEIMQWPSEIERRSTKMPEPPWPSQLWDDPYFGAHRGDAQYATADDGAYEEKEAERRERAREQQEAELERASRQQGIRESQQQEAEHREQLRQREKSRAKAQRQQKAREHQRSQPPDTPEQQFVRGDVSRKAREHLQRATQQASRSAKKAVHKAVSDATGAEIPSPDELEAMVGQLGLAGTVQEIMKCTNWDFRKAAHYLAKVRQSR